MRIRFFLSLTALLAATLATQPATAQTGPFDLAGLYDLGQLLLDGNGDDVPDRLGATLILAPDPTPAEEVAAAEIAARLGFETMALDLPLRRGVRPGQIGIVVGHRALAEAGLDISDFVPLPRPRRRPSPNPTGSATALPPTIVARTTPSGERWLAVLGGTDDDLLRAARLLAGSLPHLRTLSGPSLGDVRTELADWLVAGDSTAHAPPISFTRVTLQSAGIGEGIALPAAAGQSDQPPPAMTGPGALHLFAEFASAEDRNETGNSSIISASEALDRLQLLAWERLGEARAGPDSDPLRFPGLAILTLSAGARQVHLPTQATTEANAQSARSGGAGKDELDLSNLYSGEGLLGGGPIPDRIDALLVPAAGTEGIAELAARLGLESTGLAIPIAKRPEEIESAAQEPTLVLAGTDHPLIAELSDSGRARPDTLPPGHGLIEVVPEAFGDKAALLATGPDSEGAARALRRLAEVFPFVGRREEGAPTFDDVEAALWGSLSGYTPAGQAAIGLYKLDRIVAGLMEEGIEVAEAEVLLSVEKVEAELADLVRARMGALGADAIGVTLDNRDVQRADTLFDDRFVVPSEVAALRQEIEQVLPGIEAGEGVRIAARISEPPQVRRALEDEIRSHLIAAGADPERTEVQVLSAFKQGFSWLRESVTPRLAVAEIGEITIEFLRNDPPAEWPQQAIHTPVRWLHEIFPIDEIMARDLGIEVDRIRFRMVESGPTYRVRATAPDGRSILDETFDPVQLLRPYLDRFRDYEQVRVTTGWLTAIAGADTLAHRRIVTDPEWFWDRFQARTLPAIYDHVMELHEGLPRGGGADAPFFGTLTVELALSEPDYRLNIDNEIVAPMDALHEEIYFGTIEFFDMIGRNSRGQGLNWPGRIIPIMRPRGDGEAGWGRITLTGFATSRPAVVVRYVTRDGERGERRLDIPRMQMERPSLRRVVVAPTSPSLARLELWTRADTERDEREALVRLAPPRTVDTQMISAEQVAATVANLGELREVGLYADALAWEDVGEVAVHVEWPVERDTLFFGAASTPMSPSPDSAAPRMTALLPANGVPRPHPAWQDLVPEGWRYSGQDLVQWDTPMPPPEGHRILAQMAQAFAEARMYKAGESYLGRTTWAMDLTAPVDATHWSRIKATTFKPTVIYSARQHANEVSSTSHVLRHAELLLTDSIQRNRLNKVNVVIHPFTNPDGAQLAYDLYRITPDYILHAGYLGSLGMDVSAGGGDFPIYPESQVRRRLWDLWLPDIFSIRTGTPVISLYNSFRNSADLCAAAVSPNATGASTRAGSCRDSAISTAPIFPATATPPSGFATTLPAQSMQTPMSSQ